jgi:DNA-binding transcriptional regulator YiaG
MYHHMKGKKLRRIRARLELTQTELAERLGVTRNTVARWERDEVPIREPMARLIRMVAEAGKEK